MAWDLEGLIADLLLHISCAGEQGERPSLYIEIDLRLDVYSAALDCLGLPALNIRSTREDYMLTFTRMFRLDFARGYSSEN